MARKIPIPNPDTEGFWTGGADGELRIMRCTNCRKYHHPPSPVCPYCSTMDPIPTAVSGKGTVHTFTINKQAWNEDDKDPYVVAIVELPEQPGLRFQTNIVNCPPEDVRIDAPVKVVFEHIEDVWFPLFELDR